MGIPWLRAAGEGTCDPGRLTPLVVFGADPVISGLGRTQRAAMMGGAKVPTGGQLASVRSAWALGSSFLLDQVG